MHPDMLLLTERLVVAIERMSQDVNNLSAYVYDLSYSVTHFLSEKRGKDGISSVLCNESDSLPFGTPEARHEASVRSEYPWQCEQADESSVSYIDNLENVESSVGDTASTSLDHNEDSNILSSFTEEMKTEEQHAGEENYESFEAHNTYDRGRNYVKTSEETESPTQSESEREGQLFGVPTTVNNPHTQLSILRRGPFPTEGEDCTGNSSNCDTAETAKDEGSVSEGCFPLREERNINIAIEVRQDKECTTPMDRQGAGSAVDNTPTVKSTLKFNTGRKMFRSASYSTNSSLVDHTRRHSEGRPYKCHICGKSFTENGSLKRHMMLHSGERPFICCTCGKGFAQNGNLKIHMRCHTGERPYRCSQCGHAFSHSSHLTVHMRSHTGERPFACATCGCCFTQLGTLIHHRLRVHGVSPPLP